MTTSDYMFILLLWLMLLCLVFGTLAFITDVIIPKLRRRD